MYIQSNLYMEHILQVYTAPALHCSACIPPPPPRSGSTDCSTKTSETSSIMSTHRVSYLRSPLLPYLCYPISLNISNRCGSICSSRSPVLAGNRPGRRTDKNQYSRTLLPANTVSARSRYNRPPPLLTNISISTKIDSSETAKFTKVKLN